jgi:hypothetical protein
MAYTGPFPHTNSATITAILVSHRSFSGVVGNTGIITPGGITVTDSTINGSIVDTGGASAAPLASMAAARSPAPQKGSLISRESTLAALLMPA